MSFGFRSLDLKSRGCDVVLKQVGVSYQMTEMRSLASAHQSAKTSWVTRWRISIVSLVRDCHRTGASIHRCQFMACGTESWRCLKDHAQEVTLAETGLASFLYICWPLGRFYEWVEVTSTPSTLVQILAVGVHESMYKNSARWVLQGRPLNTMFCSKLLSRTHQGQNHQLLFHVMAS